MGILNVTPDSFSDGGQYMNIASALQQTEKMLSEGADIIDIGGESSRPGSAPVSIDGQISRVVPIISAIRSELSETVLISIDTTSSEVAKAAINAGANIINDISAGQHDPHIFSIAAEKNAAIILMHMQGTPKTMQDKPYYKDVVNEVMDSLNDSIAEALHSEVKKENIIIDPGIGFGKRREDNLNLLAHLEQLVEMGFPVLLGTSRKRFMGSLCDVSEPAELAAATAATTALGVMVGVQLFRVHDVKENRQAADVAWAIKYATCQTD
ncbi:MAG: dihydropteroate synthase [Methylococcales symbiont of Hymedesmia sp. n. MRB-2018]|nr:MAG: dihydropteroate synthase [Methylococcales symbiont of Hymedesmia sp. n. MRB-2018]KAF3984495.1 MAG: dihydropteroate synthase [Methylococcales symbiont of Hymedesmia sp. n. MRB-2018]